MCHCLGMRKYIGGMKVDTIKRFSGVEIVGSFVHKYTFGGVQYSCGHVNRWMTLKCNDFIEIGNKDNWVFEPV